MSIVAKFSVDESAPIGNQSSHHSELAPASPKVLGLELLRFTSAMAVLFYHYNHFPKIPGAPAMARADIPFYAWLWPLYDYGQFGVQLFWGISGYIFFWKYGRSIHTGELSALRFFWLRFSRLYPLHFATLILVAALQIAHRHLTGADYVFPSGDLGQFLRQLFMATDWGAQPSRSFNGPFWSVSAEVAVYAGFFLLLRRYPPTLTLCLSIVMIGLAMQLSGIDSVPASCAIFFFAGGMAAQIKEPHSAIRVAAAAIGAGIIWTSGNAGVLRNLSYVPSVLLFSLPFLLLTLAGDLPGLGRFQRGIQAAGNLTYSTYLLNFPMQLMFALAVASGWAMPDLRSPAFLLAYLASVTIAGAICYREFELTAQAWIRQRTLPPMVHQAEINA